MLKENLRTPAEVREWLERHGVPVSVWARTHGFEPSIVLALLSGRTRGRWGEAHRAAIALGLRRAPRANERSPLDTEPASPRAALPEGGISTTEGTYVT